MSALNTQSIHAESASNDHRPEGNQLVIHVLAPLVVMGATWGVRKALDNGYRRFAGHSAPNAHDTQISLVSALAWAAVTAASAAVVEVAVYRFVAKKG
jgi:hypothetical protein